MLDFRPAQVHGKPQREKHDEAGMRWAVQAALSTYRNPDQWRRLMENGMAADFSWSEQGKLYGLVYTRLAAS